MLLNILQLHKITLDSTVDWSGHYVHFLLTPLSLQSPRRHSCGLLRLEAGERVGLLKTERQICKLKEGYIAVLNHKIAS